MKNLEGRNDSEDIGVDEIVLVALEWILQKHAARL